MNNEIYEVRINNIVTIFFDSKSDVKVLYNSAVSFLEKLKEQNNNV